jgi:hypothetical protein
MSIPEGLSRMASESASNILTVKEPIFFNTTKGDFGFLSNFFRSPVTDQETGIVFETVEQ